VISDIPPMLMSRTAKRPSAVGIFTRKLRGASTLRSRRRLRPEFAGCEPSESDPGFISLPERLLVEAGSWNT
jgi:hypothetical protein